MEEVFGVLLPYMISIALDRVYASNCDEPSSSIPASCRGNHGHLHSYNPCFLLAPCINLLPLATHLPLLIMTPRVLK
ncbi:hypothetical protein F5B17DRAFT_422142 [Nemania serpens]|nr:hypothetical protein F5B17DRAFT_422142 [Nemania serpens]